MCSDAARRDLPILHYHGASDDVIGASLALVRIHASDRRLRVGNNLLMTAELKRSAVSTSLAVLGLQR